MSNTKEYNRSYHEENKIERNKQIRSRQLQNKDTISAYKLSIGCSICGYMKSARALQFHHTSDNKEGSIARMITQGRALKAIREEMDKCICVCANCHAEIHENEILSSRGQG